MTRSLIQTPYSRAYWLSGHAPQNRTPRAGHL